MTDLIGTIGQAGESASDLTTIDIAASTTETSRHLEGTGTETLPILEETMTVSKRQVVTGLVRVSTVTETRDEIAEVALDRNVVDVTRVPIGTRIEVAPAVRTEGDTTIVPVVEERLVVTKQLFLVEELHIRHHIEHEVAHRSVPLRRQQVKIERLDASGREVGSNSSET